MSDATTPPRTLRAEVEELFDRAWDTGDIIIELRRRGRRFENRSVIVMCSQLRLRGGYSQKIVPPGAPAPLYVALDEETRQITDLAAQERSMKPHDLIKVVWARLVDENLIDALYPIVEA